MNRKEIDKLPTPLTARFRERLMDALYDSPKSRELHWQELSESLERKLAAAVMLLQSVRLRFPYTPQGDSMGFEIDEMLYTLKKDSHEQG